MCPVEYKGNHKRWEISFCSDKLLQTGQTMQETWIVGAVWIFAAEVWNLVELKHEESVQIKRLYKNALLRSFKTADDDLHSLNVHVCTVNSHCLAGSAKGTPPRIALLRWSHILVHMFLQQMAAHQVWFSKEIKDFSERMCTNLSKFIGDVFSCFFTPLLDLSFKLLVGFRSFRS